MGERAHDAWQHGVCLSFARPELRAPTPYTLGFQQPLI